MRGRVSRHVTDAHRARSERVVVVSERGATNFAHQRSFYMRKYLLAVALLLGLGALPTAAHAQFCPGPGYVFVDVQAADPFCPVITWVADRGITLGCADLGG